MMFAVWSPISCSMISIAYFTASFVTEDKPLEYHF